MPKMVLMKCAKTVPRKNKVKRDDLHHYIYICRSFARRKQINTMDMLHYIKITNLTRKALKYITINKRKDKIL